MSTIFYPPAAFFFSVQVIGSGAGSPASSVDASFQEVSGIQAELEVQTVVEGGENRFAYRLPRYVKYPNLVLRRGAVTKGSTLGDWVTSTLGTGLAKPVEPRDLMVNLLNTTGSPLLSWTFVRAYPVKWDLAPLESMQNKVLIESLELAYNYFNRVAATG